MRRFAHFLALVALAAPISAKESLGVYSNWASFRDDDGSRCYAIAKPRGGNSSAAFATVANWPGRNIRGQVHFRLSRNVSQGGSISLRIGSTTFALTARGRDAWTSDGKTDAAIVAAMRSASSMRVRGAGISDRYDLAGVATAIDAAVVGCTQR